jgi:ribosomal-protein-alanine N-acetyltransferase
MTTADVPVVSSLDQKVDSAPWSEKLFSDCIRVGYECWVITNQLQIVGFGIMNYATTEAHLLKLSIGPEHQRQGLGQKMLLHLMSMAKIHGAEEMFLEVRVSNTPAITLYEKHHFVEVGIRKGYYPANEVLGTPKEDAITMALPLW